MTMALMIKVARVLEATGAKNRLLHGPLGMVPAIEYEQVHYASLTERFQPA
jgi:hypothetical protein